MGTWVGLTVQKLLLKHVAAKIMILLVVLGTMSIPHCILSLDTHTHTHVHMRSYHRTVAPLSTLHVLLHALNVMRCLACATMHAEVQWLPTIGSPGLLQIYIQSTGAGIAQAVLTSFLPAIYCPNVAMTSGIRCDRNNSISYSGCLLQKKN